MSLVQSIIDGRMRPSTPYSRWTEISNKRYTATPPTTSSITMSDTTGLVPGLPIRYRLVDGSLLFGVITGVTPNALITTAGPPISDDISRLDVGLPDQIELINLFVGGLYADANDSNLLENDENTFVRWDNAPAFVVAFAVRQTVADGSSQPRVTIMAGGAAVSTQNSDEGPDVPVGSWSDNGASQINVPNYALGKGEALELQVTTTGGDGNAENLTVTGTIVYQD